MATEVINADDPTVFIDEPIAGQTRIELPTLTYNVGTGELFVFYNGNALIIGQDYTESAPNEVILTFIPDAVGPDIDVFAFQTISIGSSDFIPPPCIFNQVDMPKRPNNFGGRFVFP